MKTLQEKYNAVLEGKYPKSQFVRSAQIEVPTFISKYSGFADSVQILKNKGLISEAKDKAPEYDKPASGYNLYDLDRGVDYELEKLGIDTGTEVPDEKTHLKAKAKAEKNLEKNPNYYLHILAGDNTPYPDPSQDSHDREVEVDQKKLFKGTVDPKGGKAEGNIDTFNAMKKATLREAAMGKGYTKEQVEAAIKRLQEKKVKDHDGDEHMVHEVIGDLFAPGNARYHLDMPVEKIAEALKDHQDSLTAQGVKDAMDLYDKLAADGTLEKGISIVKAKHIPKLKQAFDLIGLYGSEVSEKKGNYKSAKPTYSEEKIDEGDPIVDEHEFDFFKEILDGRYKDEEIEEYLKSDDYQEALQTLNLDVSDTEEWIGEFANFYSDGADAYIDEGSIKEAVKKVIKHVLNENHQSLDIEVARRIEGLLNINKKSDFLKAGYRLIEDLIEDDPFDKNDVISHLANELNLHVPIRDLFKEGALNERVGGLQEFINLIQDRAVDSEFSEEEEAMEVIEAIADHYGIKIQIGGFVGEKINEALNKSLQAFGPDLQKRLQTVGLQAKVFPKAPEGEMFKRLQGNPKLAYIHYFKSEPRGDNPFENEVITIYAGEKAKESIQKVVDYFNLDDTDYGPDKDAGWVIKNAINKNPGDIMTSKLGIMNGLAQIKIYRFEQGAYKNVKTTDKETGKADYLKAAE